MSDLLLLGGVALCVLSIILAVIQLLRTEPPRAAAITLILGIAAILAAAYLVPDPVGVTDLAGAWARVTGTAVSAQ